MALDSAAVFAARLAELGLDSLLPKFVSLGFSTYGDFAYASDPNSRDETTFLRDIVVPLLGREDSPLKARLRRLHFEAFTLATQDLRRKVESRADDAPTQIPDLEREKRRLNLAGRLTGIPVLDETEPSHHLQDLAFDIYSKNASKFIEWHDCSTRNAESKGQKKDTHWKTDSSGFVREHTVMIGPNATYNTDLALKNLLQRRGLALDMADVMSYEAHDKIVSLLFTEYSKEQPVGWGKVTVEQLHRTDKEIWSQIANHCRTGVRRVPGGVRPVEACLDEVLKDYGVRMLLQPLKSGAGGEGSGSRRTSLEMSSGSVAQPTLSKSGAKRQRHKDRQAEEIKKLKRQLSTPPPPVWQPPRKGDKGGKGRGKGDKDGLHGKAGRTPSGDNICFNHNISGCTGAKDGAKCAKGWHLCCEPGCFKPHSLVNHR